MWTLAFILLAGAVRAHPAVPATLPPAVYADTEVSTNIPFTAALNVSGRFSFNLSCWATPSNNVEVAFGTDANTNGVLDLEEIGLDASLETFTVSVTPDGTMFIMR